MNKINDNLYTFEGQQDIVSPQLVYYPAIIRENIRKMIDIAGGTARLWPHIKTHKMAEVVQMQIEAGIDRFKCATIAEAEMAAKAGAKHLTLAYPLVGPNIKRFAALQAAFPEVEFFAIGDDTEQIRKLGQTCKTNVLMDVDMGQHRTGVPLDKVEAMKHTYYKLKLECLVILGGNGSQKTANLLREEGLNIVSLPKTIDNDLWGSDLTFGFHSAVDVATNAIDCIHTTAASHGRVFIVEIMGHKVGWLALYAGIAGGADIILLPEIPYDIDVVVNAIRSRTKNGKNFTILAVAEGAISKENAALTKKELKEKKKNGPVYPSVAYELGAQISERAGQEIRVTVPGHMQRGGEPCPYDRVIATRLGAEAAEMIRRKEYGYMVALNNNKIEKIPLADIAGKLKMVDPKSDIIREAKDVGISFGDE